MSNICKLVWGKYMPEMTIIKKDIDDYKENKREKDVKIEEQTEEECTQIMKILKQRKAAGVDNIYNKLLN